mgnify:CR=1 FL=1
MKNQIGLWIDHKKAVIVRMLDGSMETVLSGLENVFTASGSHGNAGIDAKYYPAEDIHDRHMAKMLEEYYERVARTLKTPDSVYVIGPGEAKIEFTHVLKKIGAKVEAVETADRMTDKQIAAQVRHHFAQIA